MLRSWIALALFAFCAAADGASSVRAIRGATLIDGLGGAPVANANIVVRGGRIDCAGAGCRIPANADVLDGRGMFVTPGLVDSHVHFSQTAWADGRPDLLDLRKIHPYEKTVADLKTNPARFARSFLCAGITSVFDVGGYPWTLQLHEQADTSWPHVVAAGPLLSTSDHWLNLPAERQFIHLASDEAARGGVRYLASQGAKAIKVWYLGENAFAAAAGDEAAKLNLPLIVHATELALAKAAVRAGAKLLVHSVWDAPVDDELIALMKEQGTVLSPTLTVMGGYVRIFESVASRTPPVVDDPNHCVDPATMTKIASTATLDPALADANLLARRRMRSDERAAMAAANLKRLAGAGIPIATGTDAGNPITVHGPSIYAEMEAMQKAGMTPMQVIVASTAVAARAAGLDAVTGTIEKGRDADLLILTADPSKDVVNFRRIKFVMRGGVLRSIEELSKVARASSPP